MNIKSAQQLIDFEDKVAAAFNSGKILAPIHLYSNNEEALIKIFQNVKPEDWVFCSWRSHYQCLLKGVPENIVYQAILEGKSISLCFPEQRVFSSAIVGGHVSWATGLAMSLKYQKTKEHVWCFLGDMTSEVGIVQTCFRFAEAHDLPITFVIEDNGLSVMTETREVWATKTLRYEEKTSSKIQSYSYVNKYPHAGAGIRVNF